MTDQGFYKSLLDNLFDGVYFVDQERVITYWNQTAEAISGFRSDEVVGKNCAHQLLMHIDDNGTHLCKEMCPLALTIQDGNPRREEVYLHHKDGHRVPVLIRVTPIRDAQGEIVGAVEIFSDNTSRLASLQRIQELEHLAYVDALTGLANRRYTELGLKHRYEEMKRYHWPFGLLMLDIDRFKGVNDRFGHEVGDRVLRMVAKSLAGAARSFDLVGRWGGDEFVAIVANTKVDDLRRIAQRFLVLVEKSQLNLDGNRVRVTVSIGAALAGPDDTRSGLLRRADQLMYRSKTAGGNRVSLET